MDDHPCVPGCSTCDLEPKPGEAQADWLARVAALYRAMLDACVNGHPWTVETTRILRSGARACRICRNASAVAYQRRRRKGVAA